MSENGTKVNPAKDPRWKRKKAQGEVVRVSRRQLIREMGHPKNWEKQSREKEFKQRLRNGQADLDIRGIKGVPGSPGFLAYLRQSLIDPRGATVGFLSQRERDCIVLETYREVTILIGLFTHRLAKLERSEEALVSYIKDLESAAEYELKSISDPEKEPIDILTNITRLQNMQHSRNAIEIEGEMVKYCIILERLRSGRKW